MLTEICQYLKNWFNRKPNGEEYPKYSGTVKIHDGVITFSGDFALANGQYFRILGSLFNEGVHIYGGSDLKDEEFDGAVWSMAVPPVIVSLANEIAAWQEKYGSVESEAMSPFQSESFGGYSYSKPQSYASSQNGSQSNWESIYAASLAPWRKI